MTEKAIIVQNLGKQYRIGAQQRSYGSLRETLTNAVQTPFRRARSVLREKSAFLSEEKFWALQDVSFEVNRGEIVGIIGRNGAGKSTLLKVLSRITQPTTGQAVINGRMGSLLEVGTGFHPELTGRDNVFLNGAILGMQQQEIQRKFDEIVAFAEVEKFIDTQVKHYSSGMYLRLAFSVAAHLETEILLVDEVLAVGDARFQRKCLGKMGEAAEEGRTILFVSHNMTAVQSLCQRGIWINDGQVVRDDAISEVVAAYLSGNSIFENEHIWPTPDEAPGTDEIRINAVRVRRQDDADDDVLAMNTSLAIDIDFWIFAPDTAMSITLQVLNEQGVIAFATGPGDDPDWQGDVLPRGLFRNTCYIPANLLNEGRYYVHLLAVKDQSRVVYRHEYIVSFDVVDTSARVAWYGKRAGVLRPFMKWTNAQLDDLEAHDALIQETSTNNGQSSL